MKTILYKANSRGHAYHGWLDTWHTFSFAGYFNPARMNFGLLRVINDDKIAGGQGFGTHPHENMEIVTIPLAGALAHKDSMGNIHTIEPGEVQAMSAGTGITHSEYNALADTTVELFQIWVFPRAQGLKPRYDQKAFDFDKRHNDFTTIVSPENNTTEGSLWLYQDVWFSIGSFDKDHSSTYQVKKKGNGVLAMVIEGEFEVAGAHLSRRDAIGIVDVDSLAINALSDNARILLIDVPMSDNE